MKSPRATDTELVKDTFQDITFYRCPKTNGMWFEPGDLDKIITLDKHHDVDNYKKHMPADGEDIISSLECPHGHGKMIKLQSLQNPNVTLDMCPHCHGTWLDAGELQEIETYGMLKKVRDWYWQHFIKVI